MKSCRIITGEKREGKSTRMMQIANEIPNSVGFIMPVSESGYSLYSISSNKAVLFMTDRDIFPDRIGKWYYDHSLFEKVLDELSEVFSGTVLIDEVGRLELDEGGYAPVLRLLKDRDIDLVVSVRKSFVDDVIRKFFQGEKVSVEALS